MGLAALDGGTVTAAPHPDARRLGAVGRVDAVNPALLETLLAAGRVPVLSSLAADGGRLLNVNADDLAAALAGALGARSLVLLSDTPGVRLGGEWVARLEGEALGDAISHPEVAGGMKPKLAAARAALGAGVSRVQIADWAGPGTLVALLSATPPGTTIAAAREEVLRG